MELKGKVIVVTGGAGLLGRVFCEAICVAGGSVVVADKSDAAGKELVLDLASRFEGRAIFCSLDVTSDSSVEVLIETTHAKFGKIDALVNNANKNYGKVQTANLAAEAGHDPLVGDAGGDAELIPELEFDQTLGW